MGKHVNHKTEGAKYKLFKTLYKAWTIRAVMDRLGITKNKYQTFFDKAIMEDLKEPERPISFNVHAKTAFSENEDDYGTKILWPIRIQNSPITKKEATELEAVVKTYKAQFNL